MPDSQDTRVVNGAEACSHPPSKIAYLDGSSYTVEGSTVRMWAECECTSPTIVTMRIDSVEYDDGEDAELYTDD